MGCCASAPEERAAPPPQQQQQRQQLPRGQQKVMVRKAGEIRLEFVPCELFAKEVAAKFHQYDYYGFRAINIVPPYDLGTYGDRNYDLIFEPKEEFQGYDAATKWEYKQLLFEPRLFEARQQVVQEHAADGWQFVQIIPPWSIPALKAEHPKFEVWMRRPEQYTISYRTPEFEFLPVPIEDQLDRTFLDTIDEYLSNGWRYRQLVTPWVLGEYRSDNFLWVFERYFGEPPRCTVVEIKRENYALEFLASVEHYTNEGWKLVQCLPPWKAGETRHETFTLIFEEFS